MPNRSEAHSTLKRRILLELGARSDCRVWNSNTGAAQTPGGRMVRFNVPGAADISGIIRGGKRLEVEVKTGTGAPSLAQKRFRAMIEAMGGLYVLARSIEDATSAVERDLAGRGT